MPPGCSIRPYDAADAAALCRIEHEADRLFADHGHAQIAAEEPFDAAEFRDHYRRSSMLVACAGAAPVGFAAFDTVIGVFWLGQIAVAPSHQRRGVGTALLTAVIGEAVAAGYDAMWLTTFRDIPFNAPFYAGRGFREVRLETTNERLRARFFAEVPIGAGPGQRLLMRLFPS